LQTSGLAQFSFAQGEREKKGGTGGRKNEKLIDVMGVRGSARVLEKVIRK